MTSLRRLLAPLALLALAGCADDASHAAHGPTAATSLGQPDEPIAGPQGIVPQFVVDCDYSHSAMDDPIVFPGQPGRSHLHAFFGNTAVDAFTTAESLADGGTTCDQTLDKAAYWVPVLLRGPEVFTPTRATAYYRSGLGVDPTTVQPYPAGLMMIAGNAAALDPQPVSIVAWTCGVGIAREALPPVCNERRMLRLVVTFPDCWDGARLDSPDHHAHVAYSSRGACPQGYPVPVPQLQLSVEYPVWGDTTGLTLASGGLHTGHADFINGWDQDRLTTEVQLCLHRRLVCGVASGRPAD